MRLAFFGGSFDPFHNGHLSIVRALRERRLCDELLVAPAALSPGKDAPTAAGEHRLAMAEAALAGLERVAVSDLDLRRDGPSYTVDTLASLRRARPEARLILVIGADAWRDFDDWREPRRILSLAEVVVFPRGGVRELPERPGARVHVLEDFEEPVSATELRARLARGEPVADRLPPAVDAYIRRHGLYGVRSDGPREGETTCP